MPENRLSLPQTAALLVLMSEARAISNVELNERYGVTLTGKDRTKLNDLKLVDSWKKDRSFVHELTDAGWARLAEEFRQGIEAPRSGSPGAALRALVAGLQRFMERTDQSLASVFARDEDLHPAASPASRPTPDIEVAAAPDIEARIRAAYTELAAKPKEWVSLAKLRPLLGDLAKADVDEALRRMNRMADVHIIPESNQKALSVHDRDAAVIIGDQDKHHLSIGA